MNPNVRTKTPSTMATRRRTVDRAACNQEVVQLRKLKHQNPIEEKLPTHIGIKRFPTPASMKFLRETVRQGIDTERKHVRLPVIEGGSVKPVTLVSAIRLDVLSSHRITPDYARGLIDALRLQRLSVEQNREETPPPRPVEAKVQSLVYSDRGEVKMILESDALREERSRLAEFLGKNGVKAYTYVKDEDPLEVIIARARVDLTSFESTNLISGIGAAMDRMNSESETPGIAIEFKPWQFTKGIDSVIAI